MTLLKRYWLPLFMTLPALVAAEPLNVDFERSSLIPKRETGVLAFLERHPEFDGRGAVIAVFDTGVDPAAAGLQTTSTGERKIVDLIDASGAGDVDTSKEVKPDDKGKLAGLTGRSLTLPENIKNPDGGYRLGIKRASDLFYDTVMSRAKAHRKEAWERARHEIETKQMRVERVEEKAGKRKAFKKAKDDRNRAEGDLVAREALLDKLRKDFVKNDPGPVYDCVVWNDGEHFNVIVDTDEDGDLRDEKILKPFGIAGDYTHFGEQIALNFAVQVYDEGRLLSIVTVSGSHGSHVASIAAGNFPDRPERNGVAPGARILSIRIGDVRTGGSSNMTGEMRAVAACAQYGADIMNASWGGRSDREDGDDLGARLWNMLSEVYGVTAFVAAGNNGPALSTLGSPGGFASRIIGVGAYISSDMGKILHAGTGKPPETMYQFASRGPAKNGDLGVDLVAPGGAVASYSFDTLRQSRSGAGSSMATPSVAGVGALLVSAAKQQDLTVTPPRLRAALMNTAQRVEKVEVFAQGSGLPNVLAALDHLTANQEEKAWDLFYDLETHENTFRSGPGLYLRQVLASDELIPRFSIQPVFMKAATNSEKFNFYADLVFRSTVDWIEVPEYAHLTAGSIDCRPVIKFPAQEDHAPLFGEIEVLLAYAPEAGPLFRIPVTVIRPEVTEVTEGHRKAYSFELKPGEINRRFFLAPPNSNRFWLKLKRTDDGDVPRRIKLHALSVTAVSDNGQFDEVRYETFDAGEEKTFFISTAPGKTAEVSILQPWFTGSQTAWEAEIQFAGFRSDDGLVMLHENERFAPLSIVSQQDVAVKTEALIERAFYVKLPEKTEFIPTSERDRFPPKPHETESFTPVFLRQKFVVQVDKSFKIRLESSIGIDRESLSSGYFHIYHESGKRLFVGTASRKPYFTLPKGKTTFYRDIRGLDQAELKREENHPLVFSHLLSSKKSLPVYSAPRNTLSAKSTSDLNFRANRHVVVSFGDQNLSSLKDIKPTPNYFRGFVKLKTDSRWIHFYAPIEYRVGEDFKAVANQAPKPASKTTKKPALEQFADDLYSRTFTYIKTLRTTSKPEDQERRDKLLNELLEERPDDPDLYVERALIRAAQNGWLSSFHAPKVKDAKAPTGDKKKAKALRSVLGQIKKARTLSKPKATAEYFGAKESTSDEDLDTKKKAAAEEKKQSANRSRLARVALLKADVLHHAGNADGARKALKEVGRWEEKASTNTGKMELALLEAAGFDGLVLEKLNGKIGSAPTDKKLLQQRIDLYEKLGWKQFAEREKLQLKVMEDNSPVAY